MRALGLRARFPLGVYQAHKKDGKPDWFPDPARLHAALLNSAGQGPAAVLHDGRIEPATEAVTALRWLEHNPPSGIELPEQCWAAPGTGRFIYRNVSSINSKRRTEERAVSDGVSLNGDFGYFWDAVPEDIADTVEELCQDVAYLGEASSVVVIEPSEVNPTVYLDPDSSPFVVGGRLVRVPAPGRTEHLLETHRVRNPSKRPSLSRDRYSGSEQPLPPAAANDHLAQVKYRTPEATYVRRPWSQAIVLEVPGLEIPREQRVELSVAMHGALVSAIGLGAPSLVTGKFPRGSATPANRLAIQYVPARIVREKMDPTLGLDSAVLILMVPDGADDQDLKKLAVGLREVKQLWGRSIGRRPVRFSGHVLPAQEFWQPAAEGVTRFWRTELPVVPETRPVSTSALGRKWTFADSGLLSLGFAWRDELEHSGRRQELYISLRNQVAERKARVLEATVVSGRSSTWVHHTHSSVITQPWSGVLDLGEISDDTTLIAVGQSRHLGGGLLVPHDIDTIDIPEMWRS